MGLVADIKGLLSPRKRKGDGGDVEAVAAAEAALKALADARTAAQNAISSAATRRRGLLLADAPDDAIVALERETDDAHRTLERLELVEAEVLARLQEARAAARRAAWSELHARWTAAVPRYAVAMRSAIAERNKLLELAAEADGRGFSEARVIFELPPWTLADPAVIAAFEALAEQRAERAPWPRMPAPALPAPAAASSPKPSPIAPAPAASASPQPPASMRTKRTRAPEPVAGGVEVKVLRAGFETPDGVGCDVGDTITLTPTMAHQAATRGAVEYVQKGAAA
jgi:hypothetical protein